MKTLNNHYKQGVSALGWILIIAAIIILAIIFIPIIIGIVDTSSPPPSPTPVPQFSPSPSDNQIDDIVNNTDQYVGRQVQLTGYIAQVISPHALMLSSPGASNNLLVISSPSLVMPSISPVDEQDYILHENDYILIDGIVRRFDLSQAENDLNVTLDQSRLNQYDNQPAVYANQIAYSQSTPTP